MSAISSALSGIDYAESQLNSAALRLSAGSVGSDGSAGIDSVDLSSAMVDLIQARTQGSLAVQVAHTLQDMQSSLFSILG